MNLTQYQARVIDTAKAGQSPDVQAVLSTMDAEVESMSGEALHQLATMVARDSRRRHILSKVFSLTIDTELGVGQYAAVDAAMLSEFLDYGSVRVSDNANAGLGTAYERILHYADFIGPQPTAFGYYCLHRDRLYLRAPNSGSFADSPTPLQVDCSYVPTIAQVPAEAEDDLVRIGADLLLAKVKG